MSLAQQTKNTAHVVLLGRRLKVFSLFLPELLSVLSNSHIMLVVQSPILRQVSLELGLTLPRDDIKCPPISRAFWGKIVSI